MNFIWKHWYGFCILIGFLLANCVIPTQATAQSEVEISHRQVLGKTCFWTTNAQGEATTLSCVKD